MDVVGIASLVQAGHVKLIEFCDKRLQDFCKVLFLLIQLQTHLSKQLLRMLVCFGSQQDTRVALLENHCNQEFQTCPNDVLICSHFLRLHHDQTD